MAELKLILIPLIAAAITQALKFFVRTLQTRHIDFSVLNQYGGMPSGHTAFVTALATVIGFAEGVRSAAFAVALTLAVIIVRDAVSLRQSLSRFGHALKILIAEHPRREQLKFPNNIEERLGHTPLQAIVGAIIGFGLSWWLLGIIG